jgi:hypothetical protein
MDLHPFRPPDLPLRAVDDGWARVIRHGPSTLDEILGRARQRMDAEDRLEQYRADPVAYLRAHRPRSNLLDVLLHGRGKHR